MTERIGNVLAERYATVEMQTIWSDRAKIIAERRLWIAVMKAQRDLGLAQITAAAIADYERVIDEVDFDSIDRREKKAKHDVKARVEEFNALAGHQLAHLGMTSRDVTDNVEQMQVRDSLRLVSDRTVALLRRLGARILEHQVLTACGRTHNIPAQSTTLGRRFGMWAEEHITHFELLDKFRGGYLLRGIKGPVGTQQDMIALIGTNEAARLEDIVRKHLGFGGTLTAVGQVYPRSFDTATVAHLVTLASAPANFAKTMRNMAGLAQATEGFKEGQTGSSAMPHKMNMRTSERISGLNVVLHGFATMANALAGDQWYEGDVSCSVPRRVFLPSSFFAIDGLYEAAMTVLDEMAVFPAMIERELMAELPFLSTTGILMEAVKRSGGREDMHEIVKKHATASVTAVRSGGSSDAFVVSLGDDPAFPLSTEEIRALLKPEVGLAIEQADHVYQRIRRIVEHRPDAARYNPAPIR
ncbi:MAG TPA: adenylosuccinate lyase [Candidatus Paceibacterota bacterium]|nr:adenylosuccinate lyase [Candidatus Paceibacterota bacterium]